MNKELQDYFREHPLMLNLYKACVVLNGLGALFDTNDKRVKRIARDACRANVPMIDIAYLLKGLREIAGTGLAIDDGLRERARELAYLIDLAWADDLEIDRKARSLAESERWKREKGYRTLTQKIRRKKKKDPFW